MGDLTYEFMTLRLGDRLPKAHCRERHYPGMFLPYYMGKVESPKEGKKQDESGWRGSSGVEEKTGG